MAQGIGGIFSTCNFGGTGVNGLNISGTTADVC